jgi:gamma-glutamylcyclotransferase (GGCT)/AIG2-like uncharacterized protein YtfP
MTGWDLQRTDRPYFVYGTLRPRCGNSHWWRECGASAYYDCEAMAYGFKLVARTIPYALYTGDSTDFVVGALILPSDEWDEQVELRYNLDRLEGHPNHYERVETDIETPDGWCTAWIYTPTKYDPKGREDIPSGDYYEHYGKEVRG